VTGGCVRWGLFTDAALTADGQVWVGAGKLTVPCQNAEALASSRRP